MKAGQRIHAQEKRWSYAAAFLALVSLLLYTLASAYVVQICRYILNPDAVAYLRIAQYYARGQWSLAVNSCWGPLLSWLLAPAFCFHWDPLLAARILQVVAGAVFAGGTALYVYAVSKGLSQALTAMSVGLLLVFPMTFLDITPDVLLAALLIFYLWTVMKLIDSGSLRWAVLAGVLGGAAFLTKHYAFPFVLAHLLLSWGIKCVLDWRQGRLWRKSTLPFATAFAVFAAIALPWVVAMSVTDGELTFSSAGRYARAFSYANWKEELDEIHKINVPRPGRIYSFENRFEDGPPVFTLPSPFTMSGFRLLITQAKWHLAIAAETFRLADFFGLLTAGLAAVCMVVLMPPAAVTSRQRVLALWGVLSLLFYVSGHLVTNTEPRLLYPAVGMTAALVFGYGPILFERLFRSGDTPPEFSSTWRQALAGLAVWMSVGLSAFYAFCTLDDPDSVSSQYASVEQYAAALDLDAPVVAGSMDLWSLGLCLGYWSSQPFCGAAREQGPEELAPVLDTYGRVAVVVWNDSPALHALLADRRFRLRP
jgi:hypothetical protein